MNEMLSAREQRLKTVKEKLISAQMVVLIKANIPGRHKSSTQAYLLVRLFCNIIRQTLQIEHIDVFESHDGPYALCTLNNLSCEHVKQQMVTIENTHPLGRMIDLDVFDKPQHSISRLDMHLAERKCYLCDQKAVLCIRNQVHTVDELLKYVNQHVKDYLMEDIKLLIENAILQELELDPKFGLVTKTSFGSHPDMDYDLMVKAKNAILPSLMTIFEMGYDQDIELSDLLEHARHIGIQAEQSMLKATSNVNCYKGLIFVMGLVLLSTGYALKNNQSFTDIFSNIQKMSHSILEEFDKPSATFGYYAYHTYQIAGIRGEARQGFPSVSSALSLYDNSPNISLHLLLQHLIVTCEDTVLLKRCGSIEAYQTIKNQIKNLDVSQFDQITSYTKTAIKHNISFGGAADLLVSTLFLNSIKSIYYCST